MHKPQSISWIVFDIDGVLIDVSGSFMKMFYTIVEIYCRRLELHYHETQVSDLIHDIKLLPQMNDDWEAGEAILTAYILSFRDNNLQEVLLTQLRSGQSWNTISPEYGRLLNLDYSLIRHELMSVYAGDKCPDFYGIPNLFPNREGCYKSEKPLIKSNYLKKIHHHMLIYTGRNNPELHQALHLLQIPMEEFAEILDSDSGFLKPDPTPLMDFYQKYIGKDEIGIFLGDSGADQKTVDLFNQQIGLKKMLYISIGDLNTAGDYHFNSVEEALRFFSFI
ncbi:MAG: hydrolase [Calditrichia bacterium]